MNGLLAFASELLGIGAKLAVDDRTTDVAVWDGASSASVYQGPTCPSDRGKLPTFDLDPGPRRKAPNGTAKRSARLADRSGWSVEAASCLWNSTVT